MYHLPWAVKWGTQLQQTWRRVRYSKTFLPQSSLARNLATQPNSQNPKEETAVRSSSNHLRSINILKSVGPDEMHLRVLRVLVEEVVKPLCIISVWHSGELSSDWKTYSPFLKRKKGKFQELQASEYQICVWQDHGADLSGNYAKAHGKQKIDWWWLTCLHQRQIMPHKLNVIQGCITAFVENENVTDVICLYLFNVFDTVPHNVLASKMKRNWFDGGMTLLKMNELDDFIAAHTGQWYQVQSEEV